MNNDDRRLRLVKIAFDRLLENELGAGGKANDPDVEQYVVHLADAVLAEMEKGKPDENSVDETLRVAGEDHDTLLKRLARRGDTTDTGKPPPATDTLAVLRELRETFLKDGFSRSGPSLLHIDRAIREAERGEDGEHNAK